MTFRTLPMGLMATPQLTSPSSSEMEALLIARRAGLTGVPSLGKIVEVQSRIDRDLGKVEQDLRTIERGSRRLLVGLERRRSDLQLQMSALDRLMDYYG